MSVPLIVPLFVEKVPPVNPTFSVAPAGTVKLPAVMVSEDPPFLPTHHTRLSVSVVVGAEVSDIHINVNCRPAANSQTVNTTAPATARESKRLSKRYSPNATGIPD